MSNVLDVFKQDAFSLSAMTAKVNKLPYAPGQIGALGIFEEQGVETLSIMVEERDGQLALVAPSPRGGPGETRPNDKRKVRSFIIPHFQRDDSVMADQVQGIRAFGTPDQLETVEMKVDERLAVHTMALDTTIEHQRVGAVKGVITDKTGATIYDLYSEFGISAPSAINFALDTTTTDVRDKCFEVLLAIETALDGDTHAGVHSVVGETFWRKLIKHPSVVDTYKNWEAAAGLRGSPMMPFFEFGSITFERYRTGVKAAASNASGASFISATEARFIVKGVPGLWITRFAPADYVETVNTIGLPRYAKQFPMPNGKGINIEVQSNPINICTRPEVLQSASAT